MTCINLKTTFGAKYRIALERDIDGKPLDRRDPCTFQLPCKYGTIYPWGGDRLCVEVDYRPNVAATLKRMPGVQRIQDGDQEKTFRFHVDLFKQVAKIVRPYRKRQMSETQKEAAIERLKRAREVQKMPHQTPSAKAQTGTPAA